MLPECHVIMSNPRMHFLHDPSSRDRLISLVAAVSWRSRSRRATLRRAAPASMTDDGVLRICAVFDSWRMARGAGRAGACASCVAGAPYVRRAREIVLSRDRLRARSQCGCLRMR